jgi:L-asparagine oxygenase
MVNHVNSVVLSDAHKEVIKDLIFELGRCSSKDKTMVNSKILSTKIPFSVLQSIIKFKYEEKYHVLKIQNLPYPDFDRKPTPVDLDRTKYHRFSNDELQLLLISSALGDPFTWSSIQSGNLINNVFPIRTSESKIISSNATIDFGLHTEDAFHKHAGDYLLLFGYRNVTKIPTTIVYVEEDTFHDKLKDQLFKNEFIIKSNSAHQIMNYVNEPTSILFGRPEKPYIRINLNENKTTGLTKAAEEALCEAKDILQDKKTELLIDENEIVLIDNFRSVHGRDKFTPKYNGLDRWLKRIYITRDIRKSSELRKNSLNNIINV